MGARPGEVPAGRPARDRRERGLPRPLARPRAGEQAQVPARVAAARAGVRRRCGRPRRRHLARALPQGARLPARRGRAVPVGRAHAAAGVELPQPLQVRARPVRPRRRAARHGRGEGGLRPRRAQDARGPRLLPDRGGGRHVLRALRRLRGQPRPAARRRVRGDGPPHGARRLAPPQARARARRRHARDAAPGVGEVRLPRRPLRERHPAGGLHHPGGEGQRDERPGA